VLLLRCFTSPPPGLVGQEDGLQTERRPPAHLWPMVVAELPDYRAGAGLSRSTGQRSRSLPLAVRVTNPVVTAMMDANSVLSHWALHQDFSPCSFRCPIYPQCCPCDALC